MAAAPAAQPGPGAGPGSGGGSGTFTLVAQAPSPRSLLCILLPSSHFVYCRQAICQNSLDHTSSVTHGNCLFAGNIEQWRLPGDPASRTKIYAPGDDLSKGQYIFETADSPLRGTVRPDYLSHHEDGPLEGCTLDAVFAEKNPKIQDDEDEKWLVGANFLAYLKWLIYTTSFQGPKCGAVRRRFKRTSLLKDDGNVAGCPDGFGNSMNAPKFTCAMSSYLIGLT